MSRSDYPRIISEWFSTILWQHFQALVYGCKSLLSFSLANVHWSYQEYPKWTKFVIFFYDMCLSHHQLSRWIDFQERNCSCETSKTNMSFSLSLFPSFSSVLICTDWQLTPSKLAGQPYCLAMWNLVWESRWDEGLPFSSPFSKGVRIRYSHSSPPSHTWFHFRNLWPKFLVSMG